MDKKSRRPQLTLRAYCALMAGGDDDEILAMGLSDVNLSKIKKFHRLIASGMPLLQLCNSVNLDTDVAKRLWNAYYDSQRGKSLEYIEKSLKTITVFKLLVSGWSQNQLVKEGYNDEEISKAATFLAMAKDGRSETMLTWSIADEIGVQRSTVKNMSKFYRQYMEECGGEKEAAAVNNPNKKYQKESVAQAIAT